MAAACAAPQERIAFQQAYGPAGPAEPPPELPTVKVTRKRHPGRGATESLALLSSLTQFAQSARTHRGATRKCGTMPKAQEISWERLFVALDRFLERAPEDTSSYDIVRARGTLDAELGLDAQTY